MRGGLRAARARVRAFRRLGEYRRAASEATSAYRALTQRDRSDVGARVHVTSKAANPSGSPRRSVVWRGLISVCVTLVVVGLSAASLGVSQLNQGARPGPSHILVDPNAAAPAASLGAAPTSSVTTGHASITPRPTASAPGGPTPGAALAAATTPSTRPSTATGTPTATSPARTSVVPSLVVLCRAVVAVGNGWPSVLKAADRATVIAAAGKKNKVLGYCTALLASTPTP